MWTTSRSRSSLRLLVAGGALVLGCSAEVTVATSGAASAGVGGSSASTAGDGGAMTTAEGVGGTTTTAGIGGSTTASSGGATTASTGGGGPCVEGPCWVKRYAGYNKAGAYDVGMSGAGNIVFTGETVISLDFGGGALPSIGYADLFVAALDPSGQHLWSHAFGGPGVATEGDRIAVDSGGTMVITGKADGIVDLGGGPRCLPFPSYQGLVLKLDADGHHVYSVCFGAPSGSIHRTVLVALGASGDAFIAGTFNGNIDFGGGPLDSANGALFVARLDPAGQLVWVKTFGGPGGSAELGAIAEVNGGVIVGGALYGPIDFGGGPLIPQAVGVAAANVVLARFDAAGSHVWSKVFASQGSQTVSAIAVDGAGRIVITGGMSGNVDFGGGPLVSAGYADMFLASFDAAGLPLWSRRFGGPNADYGNVVRSDAAGNLVVTATLGSELSLGGAVLPSSLSGFAIARFDAAGAFLDNRFIDNAYTEGLALAGQRFTVLGQASDKVLDLGGLTSFGADPQEELVAAFAF